MTFQEVLNKLRDGKAYKFTLPVLTGYFYKAPFPEDPKQTKLDGAVSAITYYSKSSHRPITPVLMLYDFDDSDWVCEETDKHPLA
jgi:hypothetical protein